MTSRLTVPPGHRTVLTDKTGKTMYALIPSRLVVTGDAYKDSSCDSNVFSLTRESWPSGLTSKLLKT